jgi:hypothetical protein
MEEINWIQYSKQKPPINERVLVLVEGEVHEGFLDSILLMGESEPTIFQTLFTNAYRKEFSAQHGTWCHDPYWMPIPSPKPIQLRDPKWVEKLDKIMRGK